jgi:hypothetical protein
MIMPFLMSWMGPPQDMMPTKKSWTLDASNARKADLHRTLHMRPFLHVGHLYCPLEVPNVWM